MMDMMNLDTILSGLIILASSGSITYFFSSTKKGLLNKYLQTISCLRRPISCRSSVELTLSPRCSTSSTTKSTTIDTKYDLQLSMPNTLMQITDTRGRRMLSSSPSTCLNLSGVLGSCGGSGVAVTSCTCLPLDMVSNMRGWWSTWRYWRCRISQSSFRWRWVYYYGVLVSVVREVSSGSRSALTAWFSLQMLPLQTRDRVLKQNLTASMTMRASGTAWWSSLTLDRMKNQQMNWILRRCWMILALLGACIGAPGWWVINSRGIKQ